MFMEAVIGKLQDFSIFGEDEVLGVDDGWIQEGREAVKFGLIGKLLSRKMVRYEVLKDLFTVLWNRLEVLRSERFMMI